jgi:hypothetical protein
MADSAYPITLVRPEWVMQPEQLGSKQKFWYLPSDTGLSSDLPPWLFKFPQTGTGQHWAEKVAAEVAHELGITHAVVELAMFEGQLGSTTESFARDGRELYHGNQILAGALDQYDPDRKFRQGSHTLRNIFLALDRTFSTEEGARRTKGPLAEYLVFDALIGNTDRHHENWGLLRKTVGDKMFAFLAPSFDHASSLGRELQDTGPKKCRERLIDQKRIGEYAERAHGGIFWTGEESKAPSPLELVRLATADFPEFFRPALEKLGNLERSRLDNILGGVPDDCITPLARRFAVELVCYNLAELQKLLR